MKRIFRNCKKHFLEMSFGNYGYKGDEKILEIMTMYAIIGDLEKFKEYLEIYPDLPIQFFCEHVWLHQDIAMYLYYRFNFEITTKFMERVQYKTFLYFLEYYENDEISLKTFQKSMFSFFADNDRQISDIFLLLRDPRLNVYEITDAPVSIMRFINLEKEKFANNSERVKYYKLSAQIEELEQILESIDQVALDNQVLDIFYENESKTLKRLKSHRN